MSDEKDPRELVATVDYYIATSFNGRFTPEDRQDIRQDAFVGLALKRAREPVEDTEAVLIARARSAALMRLRSADRRRRHSFDPHEVEIPDPGADPEELCLRADEDRRVRVLIEQLERQERSVLKLRLEHELEAKEIARQLGLSKSRTHRLLKQAGHALIAAIGASELGEFSRRQRSLLAAVVMGIATERQRRAGAELLEDPHARAVVAELRGLGQKAAAVLPLPPVAAAEHSAGRLSELAAHVKGQLIEGGTAAKQHATAVYVRAGDPTPLAGARPGTVAATLASCIALGGGAVCAVEGLPDQLGAPLGLEQQPKSEAKLRAKAPEPPKPPVAAPPAAPPSPPLPPTTPKPTSPAPAPAPPPPPPPAPQEQFGIEQPAPASPASAAPPPPPSSGGGGESFGIE